MLTRLASARSRAPLHEEELAEALHALAQGRPAAELPGPVGEALAALEHTLREKDQTIANVAAAAQAAQDASDQANAAKSAFLANMSHELRTPLNAIIGFGELIVDEHGADSDLADDVACILKAGRHLLSLVGDILDLARVEAGRFDLQLGMVDLAELALDVTDSMRPVVERQGNLLSLEVRARPVLLTDATKVRQVLINLLANAAKFTRKGRIHVVVDTTEWAATLAVRDTGCGVAPERQRAVFEPFTQEEANTFVEHGGTGLGLAITRRFCQLLGGDVSLRSTPGEGSTFTVELPRPPETS